MISQRIPIYPRPQEWVVVAVADLVESGFAIPAVGGEPGFPVVGGAALDDEAGIHHPARSEGVVAVAFLHRA